VLQDPFVSSSIEDKENFFFHAKNDRVGIKNIFFKHLVKGDFKVRFVVARKIETVFIKWHNSSEGVFYDDLITKLFKNVLYKSKQNVIYFSIRRNKTRQKPWRMQF
jgi:hypothetical protein